MGSGYYGEPNLGSAAGGGTSSKKSSKKGNSEKPNKQPQRGLGVAQLEKIRLHSQMGSSCSTNYYHHHLPNNPYQEDVVRLQTGYNSSSSSFSYSTPSSSSFSYSTPSSSSYGFPAHQTNIVMGLSDLESANLRYGDAQPAPCPTRWTHAAAAATANGFLDTQHFTQPSMTRQLLDLQVHDHHLQEDTLEKRRRKDGSDNSSGHQDLDLELRLSL